MFNKKVFIAGHTEFSMVVRQAQKDGFVLY
jgi:hypothetical protein